MKFIWLSLTLLAWSFIRFFPRPEGPKKAPEDGGEAIEIELGAVGGELRYWRAKEAIRQGEARLDAQSAVRTALEARATALTGWAAVALLPATSVVFYSTTFAAQAGAFVAGLVLLWAAVEGIHAVHPRDWAMRGYDPSVVIFCSSRDYRDLAVGARSDVADDRGHRAILRRVHDAIERASTVLQEPSDLERQAWSLLPIEIKEGDPDPCKRKAAMTASASGARVSGGLEPRKPRLSWCV